MQYIFIYDNQIAGSTNDPDQGLPSGMLLVHYSGNESLGQLYFDGTDVLPIPPKPSPTAYWDRNKWVVPQSTIPSTSQAKVDITSTDLFKEAREVSKQSLEVLSEFSVWMFAELSMDATLLVDAKAKLVSAIERHKVTTSSTLSINGITGSNTNTTANAQVAVSATAKLGAK